MLPPALVLEQARPLQVTHLRRLVILPLPQASPVLAMVQRRPAIRPPVRSTLPRRLRTPRRHLPMDRQRHRRTRRHHPVILRPLPHTHLRRQATVRRRLLKWDVVLLPPTTAQRRLRIARHLPSIARLVPRWAVPVTDVLLRLLHPLVTALLVLCIVPLVRLLTHTPRRLRELHLTRRRHRSGLLLRLRRLGILLRKLLAPIRYVTDN